ncbi:MAG: hypothetical protein IRY99_15345 [Isosphaeraceae bacterium]|nr:hypothetical protein [Isosphaeraceae bacterium]
MNLQFRLRAVGALAPLVATLALVAGCGDTMRDAGDARGRGTIAGSREAHNDDSSTIKGNAVDKGNAGVHPLDSTGKLP